MIALFTDFGWNGPYVGQMKAVIHKLAPDQAVVDLIHNAPTFNPRSSAYLLAAFVSYFPKNTVFLCVVDPGVGSSERKPVMLKADDYWFVGPENGLFNVVAMRAKRLEYWDITWEPENISSTFHGRDLFAPVAALISNGKMYNVNEDRYPEERILPGWDDELSEIIYIDDYGNCMTGIRASTVAHDAIIDVANLSLQYQNTFSSVPAGEAFWFENSNGLVEMAMNQASLSKKLRLEIGNRVTIRN